MPRASHRLARILLWHAHWHVRYGCAAALVVCSVTLGSAQDVDYRREVRSILSNKCFACHGPDAASRVSALRLDQRDSVLAPLDSGQVPIAPGSLERSELIDRITSRDEDYRMPPPDSGKVLSAQEVATLKRWTLQGAPWSTHWSFAPPQRAPLPQVRTPSWTRHAIDRFVLARLEAKGIAPAPEADKRTLARRVSLSLTGLLPGPRAVQAFLSDTREGALERFVERLLGSPQYGEHQARYWLDAARYGDTHGLHLDNERSIWPYRDWVIRAFNANMPFDQFTIEQLAGDLLPNPTRDQLVATGFHRCNVTTSEGGAIAAEFLARYAVDRVETTSTVWMGLTAGCAACHDHKFDPISQREFYQLYAYFYNLTEKAMDGNALLPPPSIKAPTYLQQLRLEERNGELQTLTARLDAARDRAREARRKWEPQLTAEQGPSAPPGGAVLTLTADGAWPPDVQLLGAPQFIPGKVGQAASLDGRTALQFTEIGNFDREDRFSYGGWLRFEDRDSKTLLSKMHDAQDFRGYDLYLGAGKVFVHLVHRWDQNAIRVNTTLPLRRDKWQHVFVTYDGSSRAAGVTVYVDGTQQDLEVTHDSLTQTIRTEKPLKVGGRDASSPFRGSFDELFVYDRTLTAAEVQTLADASPLAKILATPVEARSSAEDEQLVDHYLRAHDPHARALFENITAKRRQIAQWKNQFSSTLVMQERSTPRQAHVLTRGQYDQPGEPVSPGVPQALPPSRAKQPSRLTLARWLVNGEHPLTARVTVNRIWQQHFGVGLVKTAEDFGSQGEWPSHPELLDHLAIELVESGWDIKALHRAIVTSATFRQASRRRAPLADPENRLLARGPRFRLDAEVIRDLALASGQLLTDPIGGPSVKPYQPAGLWKVVGYPTSTTATFKQDHGASLFRRSLYTFWKRTAPPPAMQILDAPTREVCTVRRPRTNTPGAALLLMNDVQFIEAARVFAYRILTRGEQDPLGLAFEIALTRPPRASERAVLGALHDEALRTYRNHPQLANALLAHGEHPLPRHVDPVSLAAWTLVANAILNLDEFLTQH